MKNRAMLNSVPPCKLIASFRLQETLLGYYVCLALVFHLLDTVRDTRIRGQNTSLKPYLTGGGEFRDIGATRPHLLHR